MANPPETINRYFSWKFVLPVLGVKFRTAVLPAILKCPLCDDETLRVFDDRLLGGQWTHCNGCQFAGDLIELAAAKWNTSAEDAVWRLQAEVDYFDSKACDPDRVTAYFQHHLDYRRRFADFWSHAQDEPIRSPSTSLVHLLRLFNATDQARARQWQDHGGQLVGAAHRRELEDLFQPLSHAVSLRANHDGQKTERRGSGGGSKGRIFVGNNWEDLLVIPHRDLPGRICALTLIGREAEPGNGDVIFKTANLGNASTTPREAGLGFWPALDQPPHRILGDVVFVFTDPVAALRLQLRHLRSSTQPLPIVIARAGGGAETMSVWRQLPDRRFIFWGEPAAVLKLAKESRGRISTHQVSTVEMGQNMRHNSPLKWLQLIKKHTVPWDSALRSELQSSDAARAEELLQRLDFQPDDLRKFISSCNEELRDRLARINPQRYQHRRVRLGKKIVIESEDGWHLEDGEEISNAALRIEETIYASSGRAYFRGIARLKGQDLDFTVRQSDVDRRGLLRATRDYLMHNMKGLLISQAGWSPRSEYIAMQLHEPKLVKGVDRIGWNQDRREFLFPKFWISSRGEVGQDRLPLRLEPEVPADHLREPARLTPRDIETLSQDLPEVRMAWSLAASVVHNLLAPVLNCEPIGVLLDGQAADVTGRRVAQTLGCLEIPIKARSRGHSVLETINDECQRHDWPTVLAPTRSRNTVMTSEWLGEPGLKNAILPANWFAVRTIAAHESFHVIRSDGAPGVRQVSPRVLAKIIPRYLQNLCERKIWIDQVEENHVNNIIHDMAKWFESEGPAASGDTVLAARQMFEPADTVRAWQRFVDVVCMLIDEGAMAVCESADQLIDGVHGGLIRRPAIEGERATVWISQTRLNQCLTERQALPFDPYLVFHSLQSGATWVAREEIEGEPGWAVPAEWWDLQLRQWRATREGRMSLVG